MLEGAANVLLDAGIDLSALAQEARLPLRLLEKKAVDDWINQTAQTVEVNVPEVPKLGNALAGRPTWVAGRPHRETRSGAW